LNIVEPEGALDDEALDFPAIGVDFDDGVVGVGGGASEGNVILRIR
jgi:hypothetical protein